MPAFIKRYWGPLASAFMFISPAWEFIKWAADWRGRFDVFSSTLNEAGGWKAMIAFFISPPPWLPMLCTVIGLLTIVVYQYITNKKNATPSQEWKILDEAVDLYTASELIEHRDDMFSRLCEAMDRIQETEQTVSQKQADNETLLKWPSGNDAKEIDRKRRVREIATIGERIYKESWRESWTEIRKHFCDKLEKRSLIAKGIPFPYVQGADEIEIQPHEWRLLDIDIIKNAAVEKSSGQIKYVGVVISTRD